MTAVDEPIPLDAYRGEYWHDDQRTLGPVEGRLVDGGTFVFDAPDEVPVVWGQGEEVLWAAGESLIICGPGGVGKTTLTGQIVKARVGLSDQVLGWPVEPTDRVLYLASDRPRQIQRAFRRLFTEADRDVLAQRLLVWQGPPPADIAAEPRILLELARRADATTVILDSLKDMAVGLSDDAVGAGVNRAIQTLLAAGIEVLVLHHQRKGTSSEKPKALADVYGSTWITAGAGSVVLLWGEPGDPLVELLHLKQPAAEVGPLQIEHDHTAGTSTIARGFEPLRYLRLHPKGATATDVAKAWFESRTPSDNERKKAQRRLDKLVAAGLAHKRAAELGGEGGSSGARYYAVDTTRDEPPQPTHDRADYGR